MNDLLIRHDQNGVCYLTLNRPNAYNALSMELMQALASTLDQIANDTALRAVVIKGSGKGFSAGHDLKQMLHQGTEAYYQETFDTCASLMQKVVGLPIPVIAQVKGVATAAGCQLVASCDLAICADSARFATPGVNIGLFCSTPMVAITRSVKPKHAMELLLLGDMINAERAAEMGLVNWVVDEENLENETQNIAEKIASKSRYTLSVGKQAFYKQSEQSLSQAYATCANIMTQNMLADDAQEGIDAFINKRKPSWKHR